MFDLAFDKDPSISLTDTLKIKIKDHLLSAVEAVLLLSKLLLSGVAIFNSMAKKKKRTI